MRNQYKNYEYDIEVEKENGEWVSSLEVYNDDPSAIFSKHKHKTTAIKMVQEKINQLIDEDKARELYKNDYAIYYNYPINVLKDFKDGFVYHISEKENHEGILKNGLIPSAVKSCDVLNGSILIDYYKPISVENFYRTISNYFYPEFGNWNFSKDRCNVELWAVDMSVMDKDKIRLSSQGIAGFCNCYRSNELEVPEKRVQFRRDAISMAKTYWKNSYTLQEYLNGVHEKSDKKWGIDELLYCGIVPPKHISNIGKWDDDGKFTLVNDFEFYTKEDIDYKEVIKQYQIHEREW